MRHVGGAGNGRDQHTDAEEAHRHDGKQRGVVAEHFPRHFDALNRRPADGAQHGEKDRCEDDDIAADDLAPEPGGERYRQREQVLEDAGLAVAGHRADSGDQHKNGQDRHGQLNIGNEQAGEADEAEHPRFGQAEEEEQGDDAAEDQGVDLEPASAQGFNDVEFGR